MARSVARSRSLSQGDGVLILSPESVAHFYPATPEQLINACYAAGFRAVTRGVIGDELVAAEYLKLWEDEPWGTLIRSTDSVVVETVRIAVSRAGAVPGAGHRSGSGRGPISASAAWAWAQDRVRGTCPPVNSPDLDAAITFGDLEQLFQIRGVSVLSQPTLFQRVPEERRQAPERGRRPAAGAARGGPAFEPPVPEDPGLDALKAVARAVSVDRLDLGFVDILSNEGALDHPLSGPQDQLYWRRELLRSVEAPRSRNSVLDRAVVASIGATFEIKQRRVQADPDVVDGILDAIGKGPERAALGLPRLRLRDLPAIRRGGVARPSVDAPVRAVPGAAGGRGAAGGGGGHDDGAFDVPGAARPARVRGRAEQAEQRGIRGPLPRPRPLQGCQRPVRARGRATTSCARWPRRSGTRYAPRTWRRATGAMSSW